MKIGILSDTHGFLPEEFIPELKGCDYLIHAGDIGTEMCYNKLKSLKVPIYMVKGNCDKGKWADYLPETLSFSIGGHLFYLIHDINRIPISVKGIEFIISGHTHVYSVRKQFGKTYINPGSAGKSRGVSAPGIAILNITNSNHSIQKILKQKERV